MRKFLLVALCLITMELWSQQWVVNYAVENGVILVGGDGNAEGNFILGACNYYEGCGYIDAYAMYVDNQGNYKKREFCFNGYKSYLCNAICLYDGNAFVVGVKGSELSNRVYDTLWFAVMTPDLEIVEERNYPIVEPYKTFTTDVYLDFNNDGEIIVLADVSERDYPMITNGVYAVFKCDRHCNVLKVKHFAEGHGPNGARPTSLIRVPDSDKMMLLGKGFFVNNVHSICYIDSELNVVGTYALPWLEDNWNYTDCWKDNGHFLMSSLTHHYGGSNDSYYSAIFEVDDRGNYVDTLVYDRVDTSDYTAQFGSMAYVSDDIIYVATYWENMTDVEQNDAVILLIDNELNLKGTKRLRVDNTKIRIMNCQSTSDGGCLAYGQCKNFNEGEMVFVWKLVPEDFEITWSLLESAGGSPHHDVYPNPSNGLINIILQDIYNQECKVTIGDICGKKCFEKKFENIKGGIRLDVSPLESGAYYYTVLCKGHCIQKGKFIKN